MDPATHAAIVTRKVFDEVSSYYGTNGIPFEQEKLKYVKLDVSSSSEKQGEKGSCGSY